jgi:hypothetical protein
MTIFYIHRSQRRFASQKSGIGSYSKFKELPNTGIQSTQSSKVQQCVMRSTSFSNKTKISQFFWSSTTLAYVRSEYAIIRPNQSFLKLGFKTQSNLHNLYYAYEFDEIIDDFKSLSPSLPCHGQMFTPRLAN